MSGVTEMLQHGVAEFVAQEEMARPEGFWWSSDSQWIVYQGTDNAGVEMRLAKRDLTAAKPLAVRLVGFCGIVMLVAVFW